MQLETPRKIDALSDAFEWAQAQGEPAFVPAPVFADDRGWSIMNQFQDVLGAAGQINYSVMYPGVIKAWHRHQRQSDFWLTLKGHIKVGVHDDSSGRSWMVVLGEKRVGVLIVPPGLWHGAATVGPESAGLLYYVTARYNREEPDEERRPFDSVESFPWRVQHG